MNANRIRARDFRRIGAIGRGTEICTNMGKSY
jgi:hypothetical protein